MLSGPLTLQPLGPWDHSAQLGWQCSWCRRCWWTCFCSTSTASNPGSDQPQDLPTGLAVRKWDLLTQMLCVWQAWLASVMQPLAPSCCIHWFQLVVSRSRPGGVQMEVGQSSATSGGRPDAPELWNNWEIGNTWWFLSRPMISSRSLYPGTLGRRIFKVMAHLMVRQGSQTLLPIPWNFH